MFAVRWLYDFLFLGERVADGICFFFATLGLLRNCLAAKAAGWVSII